MDATGFDLIPPDIENNLGKRLQHNDISQLSEALTQVVIDSWAEIGLLYFKLNTQTIRSIEEDARGRRLQTLRMVEAWVENDQDRATFACVNKILDEGAFIGTKHRFWNSYRSEEDRLQFKSHNNQLNEFTLKLVKCPIKESEWSEIMLLLGIQDRAGQVSDMFQHQKIRQRHELLQCWVEKRGYAAANVHALKDTLKRCRLRRVICQIAGPEENTVSMNERFIHFLEDEWDHIFSKINLEQREAVFRAVCPGEQIDDMDDAFNHVMKRGNDGFHSFIRALAGELKDSLPDKLSSKEHAKIFNIRKVYPKAPHFKETAAYAKMKENVHKGRFLELYGLPGSGKSQCASAFAKEFMDEHPLSIVWFLDCKDNQCIDESILSLKNALCDAKVHTNGRNKEASVAAMVNDIKESDLYVLLILEDLYSRTFTSTKLKNFLRLLKSNGKAFVIATTRTSNSTPQQMFQQQRVLGFTDEEAWDFLMPEGKDKNDEPYPEEDISAAKKIAERYSNLPLGIAPAKAFCDEKRLSYVDYLQAIDQEIEAMKMIQKFQDDWINEYYKTENEKAAGKNILATMILALSSLKQETLSNRTVSFLEVFSYARYFHHEKIPIYLFKQLILQPDISSPSSHRPVGDLLCKMALTNMLDQLKESSIGVVDINGKDIYAGTVSTHRVVLFALRCMDERNKEQNRSKLLNALYALACYFQKDNRLIRQHNQLLNLMPHVASALSNVENTSNNPQVTMLETMLVIRLFELKGFACTQTDAVCEAEEPLNEAYKRLVKLLCDYNGVEVENLDATVQERVLEGNGPDTYIETKARVLNQYCKKVVDKIDPEIFDLLVQTVILNEEDVALLRRNVSSPIDWKKDVKVNAPVTARALKILREQKLALPQDKLQAFYLAEQLASILYTRGRLMFYDEVCNHHEEKIKDLKLSHFITKEVFRDTGENLLHFLITDTNGLLYLLLKEEGKTAEEKQANFEKAYKKYKSYLQTTKRYFEHGILKEDGKTVYNTIRCYRQMIKANHQSMKLTGRKDYSRFKVCSDLKQLIHDNPQYAKTAVDALVVAGNFCIAGENYEMAIDIYREVMDRVRDEEEKYQKNFFKATEGFSKAALELFEKDNSSEARKTCEEASQRCDKALVLVPRASIETQVKELKDSLDQCLDVDRKRRKTTSE